jgi:hypothetical protein
VYREVNVTPLPLASDIVKLDMEMPGALWALPFSGRNAGLFAWRPQNPGGGSVQLKVKKRVVVQPANGVRHTLAVVSVSNRRQGVVYAGWPAFFFKGREDGTLISGLLAVSFTDLAAEPKFPALVVPARLRRGHGSHTDMLDESWPGVVAGVPAIWKLYSFLALDDVGQLAKNVLLFVSELFNRRALF